VNICTIYMILEHMVSNGGGIGITIPHRLKMTKYDQISRCTVMVLVPLA